MNNKKKYLFTLIIFTVGLICGVVINQYFIKMKVDQSQTIVNNQPNTAVVAKSDDKSFPWMDFPMEYFSKNDVQWGSSGKGNGDKITDYTQAAIKNKAIYQTYPTTEVKIKSYSSEIVSLKLSSPNQTQEQINKLGDIEVYKAQESYKKYGVLVSHYLPENYIYKLDKFDVDGDGNEERIVSYTQTFTAGFGAPMVDVIKGDNVVFTVNEDSAYIIPAETTNGFYVEWGTVGDPSGGRCCEEGINRTRFVFKDGKFVPIYEQEVRYLKIGKE